MTELPILLMDLDETLVKCHTGRFRAGEEFGFEVYGQRYGCTLRPDADLLDGVPFSIYTAGARLYADAIARGLRDLGFVVDQVFSREDIGFLREDGPLLPGHRGFLIDENPGIARAKMRRLPGFEWLRVHPFDNIAPGHEPGVRPTRHSLSLDRALNLIPIISRDWRRR